MEVRQCLFPDEASEVLTLFKTYSKSACLLECNIKQAYDACNCVPWNYLSFPIERTKHGTTELCDMEGNTCFEKAMDALDSALACSCWPSCIETTYSHSLMSSKIDAYKFCQRKVDIRKPEKLGNVN